uniref:ANK_REP_REGION domain-containing protein n=1 Tax=Macrostomum lignano TaxID=282301 RepID=A0A1I8JPP8_9PLAT
MMQVLLDHGALVTCGTPEASARCTVASYQATAKRFTAAQQGQPTGSARLRGLSRVHLACQPATLRDSSFVYRSIFFGLRGLDCARCGFISENWGQVKTLLCSNSDPMLAHRGTAAPPLMSPAEFGQIFGLRKSSSSVSTLLAELHFHLHFCREKPADCGHSYCCPLKSVSCLLHKDLEDEQRGQAQSCLHLAAKNGHVMCSEQRLICSLPANSRLLLGQQGRNPNRMTEHGTCLHLAAIHGQLEAVKFLLE